MSLETALLIDELFIRPIDIGVLKREDLVPSKPGERINEDHVASWPTNLLGGIDQFPDLLAASEEQPVSDLCRHFDAPRVGSCRRNPRFRALPPLFPTSMTRRQTTMLWSVLTETSFANSVHEVLNLVVADFRKGHLSEVRESDGVRMIEP